MEHQPPKVNGKLCRIVFQTIFSHQLVHAKGTCLAGPGASGAPPNLGRSPDDSFSYDEVIGAIHPDDRPQAQAAVAETIASGRDYNVEYRACWPDGTVHSILARGRVLYADAAPKKMIGVTLDITEHKQAEQRQRLLLRELDHRVKNTLAIVQAIATQTLRDTPEPAAFKAAFSARLLALARSHALLTQQGWRGAPLDDIVAAALFPFRGEDSRQLRVGGPAIMLDANAAVTLGMTLHELATNAAKYGALSKPAGEIDVAWSVRRDGGSIEAAEVDLNWTERGGPPVAPPRRRGFGRRLIEAGAKQLGAEIALEFPPEGASCRIVLPLANSGSTGEDAGAASTRG